MRRTLTTFVDGLALVCAGLSFLAFAGAVIVTVADVIARRIGLAVPGVVDLVQLFVLSGAWLAIPYAFRTGAHVAVDLFLGFLPPGLVRAAGLIAGLLAFGLLTAMLIRANESFKLQLMFGDKSQQIGIPMTWYWTPLLIGLALSILFVVLSAVVPHKPPAETEESGPR